MQCVVIIYTVYVRSYVAGTRTYTGDVLLLLLVGTPLADWAFLRMLGDVIGNLRPPSDGDGPASGRVGL